MKEYQQTEYRAAFTPEFKKMIKNWGDGFTKGVTSSELAQAMYEWIQEIYAKQIPFEWLAEYTDYIISKRRFAPTKTEYLNGISIWANEHRKGDESLKSNKEIFFDILYNELAMRYEGRWAKISTGTVEDHRNFWKKELSSINAEIDEINHAKNRLLNSGHYSMYPPTVLAFVEAIKLTRIDHNAPLIEDSYEVAVSSKNSSILHKLIRISRSKFTYTELTNTKDYSIKARFESEYRKTINSHKKENVYFFEKKIKEENSESEPASRDSSLNYLTNMLKDLKIK